MPVEEALDLIDMLPDGSRYVAATDFLRSWSEERHGFADVIDGISHLTWALCYDHEQMREPPRLTRPRDVIERMRQSAKAVMARDILENGTWEEM